MSELQVASWTIDALLTVSVYYTDAACAALTLSFVADQTKVETARAGLGRLVLRLSALGVRERTERIKTGRCEHVLVRVARQTPEFDVCFR